MAHRWSFFRAGGVDQVSLDNGSDILALGELDQKLWVALAMPVQGVDIDPETLALIDKDSDGRIRVQDVIETSAWIKTAFKNPDDVLHSSPTVKLSSIADAKIVAAAKRMLKDLGKPDTTEISVDDASAITKAFADTVLNGDGIVIPASSDDPDVKKVIEDAVTSIGSALDRSGKLGIDQPRADEMFAAVDLRAAWIKKGDDPALSPLGAATVAAYEALTAVRDKIEDYFTRCRIAAFDSRGAAALAGQDAEFVALAHHSLSAADADLAKLPLAKIDPTARLPLEHGLNPAWSARMATFTQATVVPILGARAVLTPADFAALTDRLASHSAWRTEQPKTKVDALEPTWLQTLAAPELRVQVAELIAKDAALAGEYDQITGVAKLVRLQRDGGRIFRNFVNFSDFYSKQDGVFQAGTLYIDSRAIHLCVPVADVTKHGLLASSAAAMLLYCDITRKGETKHIAAALTNGDSDNVFVGRNGIFYDRQGNDWDATITKIIVNPLSVRQAFWSPYKKLIRMVEETVAKRAAAADAKANAKVEGTGAKIGTVDKLAVVADSGPPGESKKLDFGIVAAIGLAIGGIGTLVGAILGSIFGLGKWVPLGIMAVILAISGPAMLLAWLKLRRRNLGPILDANGWAINGRAKINVAFGAVMTELATLPKGSARRLDDPFADKATPWKRWAFLALVLVLAASWYFGKLDNYLPTRVTSVEVLGENAPIVKKAASEPPAVVVPVP